MVWKPKSGLVCWSMGRRLERDDAETASRFHIQEPFNAPISWSFNQMTLDKSIMDKTVMVVGSSLREVRRAATGWDT